MAIRLEAYSLVIRRDRLEASFPGGWRQFQAEYEVGGSIWHDDALVRFGAMNDIDLELLIRRWQGKGLRLITTTRGEKSYADMCPVAVFQDSPHPCDWIEIKDETTAEFVGQLEKPRKRRLSVNWSDETVAMTRKLILEILWSSPQGRWPLPLKNFDDRFGLLRIANSSLATLVVSDRATGEEYAFRRIDELLSAGWAVD